jgi:putative transcriptional regulator
MTEKTYRCGECGEPMQRKARSIPYPESGLDNVVLRNVPVWECANGHQDVQIPDAVQLHQLLAEIIVTQATPLRGREVRFLRKHLGYSARDFSALVGMNHVHLSRLENDKRQMPRKFEVLIRLFGAQALAERSNRPFPLPLIKVLEELEAGLDIGDRELEHVDVSRGRRSEPRHVWQEATRLEHSS